MVVSRSEQPSVMCAVPGGAAGPGGAGGPGVVPRAAPRPLVWCALLALAVTAAGAAPHKRAEMSPMPFVLGSRYGRSPERVMAPRNDRFFMGSRYGKRAGLAAGAEPAGGALVCRYTGLLALYTCAPQLHKSDEDPAASSREED